MKKIEAVATPIIENGFQNQNFLALYSSVNSWPDVCAFVQLIVPGSAEVEEIQFDILRKKSNAWERNIETLYQFFEIDVRNIRVVVLSDISIASRVGLKSQLVFVVLVAEEHCSANLVHYESRPYRRVPQSVVAAKVHALVNAIGSAYIVCKIFKKLIGRELLLRALNSISTLNNVIAEDCSTAECRLQIDLFALKERYKREKLKRFGKIQKRENAKMECWWQSFWETRSVVASENKLIEDRHN